MCIVGIILAILALFLSAFIIYSKITGILCTLLGIGVLCIYLILTVFLAIPVFKRIHVRLEEKKKILLSGGKKKHNSMERKKVDPKKET
jgi:uncharacterized membrane protein